MKTNVIFKSAMLFGMMSMSTMMMAQTNVQKEKTLKKQPVEVQLNNKKVLKERPMKAIDAQTQATELKRTDVSRKDVNKVGRPAAVRRHSEIRRTRIVADTALSRKPMPAMKMKEAHLHQ